GQAYRRFVLADDLAQAGMHGADQPDHAQDDLAGEALVALGRGQFGQAAADVLHDRGLLRDGGRAVSPPRGALVDQVQAVHAGGLGQRDHVLQARARFRERGGGRGRAGLAERLLQLPGQPRDALHQRLRAPLDQLVDVAAPAGLVVLLQRGERGQQVAAQGLAVEARVHAEASRRSKILLSLSLSVPAVNGLITYPFTPACAASMICSRLASAVTISTGSEAIEASARIALSRSMPGMPGMFQSVITRSNFAFCSSTSAVVPSSASAVLVKPRSLSRFLTMRRIVEKSSTMRIRMFLSMGSGGASVLVVHDGSAPFAQPRPQPEHGLAVDLADARLADRQHGADLAKVH